MMTFILSVLIKVQAWKSNRDYFCFFSFFWSFFNLPSCFEILSKRALIFFFKDLTCFDIILLLRLKIRWLMFFDKTTDKFS